MKRFNKVFAAVLAIIAVVLILENLSLYINSKADLNRQYRVEANRVAADIGEYGFANVDLLKYSTIKGVYELSVGVQEDTASTNVQESVDAFFDTNNDYVIKRVGDKLYRIEYVAENDLFNIETAVILNAALLLMAAVVVGVLLYVRHNILKPFDRLKEVPYELSKGNLSMPVKESKNRYFGRFVWGVDLLRENMEAQKQRELELQKENKTLVLALSHDIKTPLSAIKLYAKALSKNLYDDKTKQVEIAESINAKADEIEGYVSDIIRASNDDFLDLTVNMGEFYLSQVMENILRYYSDKLGFVKTEFNVEKYSDCILKGDANRLIEVLQNIIENAIKYGDGKLIEVTFAQEEDCRLIIVRNSGCMLSASELPHIFDSFWRGSNVGNNKGSGLGLYICRKLMQAMDGEIFAHIDDVYMCVTVVARLA